MDFTRKNEIPATNIGDWTNDNTGPDQNLDNSLVMELNANQDVNSATTSDIG